MKKLRGSLPAKVTAIVLLAALALICVLSTLATAYLSDLGAYTGYQQAASRALGGKGLNYCRYAGEEYRSGSAFLVYEDTNFRYTISDAAGQELAGNYHGEESCWDNTVLVYPSFRVETGNSDGSLTEYYNTVPDETESYYSYYSEYEEAAGEESYTVTVVPSTPEPTITPGPTVTLQPAVTPASEPPVSPDTPDDEEAAAQETRGRIKVYDYKSGETLYFDSDVAVIRWRNENALQVHGYVLAGLPVEDEFSGALRTLNLLYGYRTVLPVIAGLSFLLGILLFLFLLSAAGHRDETERVTPNFVDRVPLDLLLAIIAFGVFCALAAAFNFGFDSLLGWVISGLMLLCAALLILLFCMSFATRVKLGTIWQNWLLLRVWRWFTGLLRRLRDGLRALLRALPMVWRWAAALAGAALLGLFFLAVTNVDGEAILLWLLACLVAIPAALYAVICFKKLREGARQIAEGNMSYTVDTRCLRGELREHAEDLNRIRDGMNRAVEERLRSERFRTELITNVSHDIKTPLTSIINYVDLLAKEQPESETMREYIEVLSRQSARLKKLIDDLIEASKASTGNLPVSLERCELGVLLDQTAGEYGERLQQAGLELVLDKPEQPVAVMADGRHLWRIFDNLMNNICKYALPGTRVYLSLSRQGEQALVTFRNISRGQLNVSGEELMERFVRGDSSRNTEGSGLGLSIAQSLARLQQGDMVLTVDGDLFKVTLSFPAVE